MKLIKTLALSLLMLLPTTLFADSPNPPDTENCDGSQASFCMSVFNGYPEDMLFSVTVTADGWPSPVVRNLPMPGMASTIVTTGIGEGKNFNVQLTYTNPQGQNVDCKIGNLEFGSGVAIRSDNTLYPEGVGKCTVGQ